MCGLQRQSNKNTRGPSEAITNTSYSYKTHELIRYNNTNMDFPVESHSAKDEQEGMSDEGSWILCKT